MNGRRARAARTSEASRVLPLRRGERPCTTTLGHDLPEMRAGHPCLVCKAST